MGGQKALIENTPCSALNRVGFAPSAPSTVILISRSGPRIVVAIIQNNIAIGGSGPGSMRQNLLRLNENINIVTGLEAAPGASSPHAAPCLPHAARPASQRRRRQQEK